MRVRELVREGGNGGVSECERMSKCEARRK